MKHVADILVHSGIVRVNFDDPFVWTSGIKSPIYCDCRELISLPRQRDLVVDEMVAKMKAVGDMPDIVAGTATAGIPWAALVADRLKVPMLYVRSKPKGHGAGKMVEGRVELDEPHIAVVEDALSTGGSALASVEALKKECAARVQYVFSIFSWDTPLAAKRSKEAGIHFFPLTSFKEIVDTLEEHGTITKAQQKDLYRFHEDPAGFYN
jgi:orotate phosphoribosyltransferase